MSALLRQMVGLILAFTLSASNASGNFVAIELPRGVHVELPTNWTALSDSKRTTLAAATQAQVERLSAKEPEIKMALRG